MSNKKRILHIIQSLDNGGCENMLFRTLPKLGNFQHHIITLKKPGTLASKFQDCDIKVSSLNQKSLLDLPSYSRLRKEVVKFAPDIIITYLLHADLIGRLYLRNTLSSPVIPFLRTTYNHHRYRGALLFEKLTRSLVPHYFANSEAVKTFYQENLSVAPEKISVIPNGIDTELFRPGAPNKALQEELGIDEGDTVFTCVANFHSNKGHRYLLEAFEKVYTSFPHTHLLLIGKGEEAENLARQIIAYTSKKHIHFLGQRTDIPSLLHLSHIFVLPTLFEGMSNALMEAMASGLAVITTDIPENRTLVTHEKNGLLGTPKSIPDLQKNMELLLNDPLLRERLGKTAEASIRDYFSLDKSAQKWENSLTLLLS